MALGRISLVAFQSDGLPKIEAIAIQSAAKGTNFDLLIFLSLVMRGIRWTMLVAAIISSAGSLAKSSSVDF